MSNIPLQPAKQIENAPIGLEILRPWELNVPGNSTAVNNVYAIFVGRTTLLKKNNTIH